LLGYDPVIPIALQIEWQLQRRRLHLSIAAISLATLSFLTVATLFMLAMGLLMAVVLMLVLEIRLGSRIASNI
jgi:heme/copper-type cytochrome/quinol oxidase subunit 1